MEIKRYIGKIGAFIGISVIAINQYLQLFTYKFTLLKLVGVSIIIFTIGLFADKFIKKR